jgi:hypothetical protein
MTFWNYEFNQNLSLCQSAGLIIGGGDDYGDDD